MNESEQRLYLIKALLSERSEYREINIPSDTHGQRMLLRSLMNVRPPKAISPEFQEVQDAYLQKRNAERGIVRLEELEPIQPDLYLWRGDITTLAADGIVNAANSGMTGCYRPCHNCIDNCIHTYAGIQLRNACEEIMERQGHEEATGTAKITPAFNLPAKYVLHTVGPIIYDRVTKQKKAQLISCYESCLQLALDNGLKSLAFCCISTGVFSFPNDQAAELAVQTVKKIQDEHPGAMKVIFNVFLEKDERIYKDLLR